MRRSETAGYPNGLVYVAMVNLIYKFAKTDALLATKLRQDLARLKWKEDTDPADFFEGLMNVDILSTKLANGHIIESGLFSNFSWLRQRSTYLFYSD